MSDKKRKLTQHTPGEAIERDVKKVRSEKSGHEEKGEKRKSRDVGKLMETSDSGRQVQSKEDKKEKNLKQEKTGKKDKKEKKNKRKMEANSGDNEGKPSEEGNEGDAKDVASLNFVDSEPMKLDEPDTKEAEKKEKKEKKKAKKEKQGTTKGETNDLNNSHQGEPTSKPQEELATGLTNTSTPGKKQNRFIVFVGNLPFTANVDSVSKHFAKNPPSEIRIATERNHPEKCRGFGFVEFENFDRMKSCLKLYHHSSFDDGKSPVRRINVELTAGGGGKSKNRKAKIEAKNERLEGQRKRAVEQLQQEKAKKAEIKEKGGKDDFAGVHPSRLSRMA